MLPALAVRPSMSAAALCLQGCFVLHPHEAKKRCRLIQLPLPLGFNVLHRACLQGCFVLYPPEGAEPRCLVQFIGGSFVGAAPQLAYGPLLEALAGRGALVSAGFFGM